jgi:hypothetical protein
MEYHRGSFKLVHKLHFLSLKRIPSSEYWLCGSLVDHGSIPDRGRHFLSSPRRPDRLWGPPSFLSKVFWGLFGYIYLVFTLIVSNPNLRLGLPSSLFPSVFSTKILFKFLICTMRTMCPAHLTLLDLITLIICGKPYKLWSCAVFSSPLPLPPAYVQIFSSVSCSHTQCSCEKPSFTPI